MITKHGQLDIFHITVIKKNVDLINFVLWLNKMNLTQLHPDDPINDYIKTNPYFKDLEENLFKNVCFKIEKLIHQSKLFNENFLYDLLFSLNEDLGLLTRENWGSK
tara:strand:+ start:10119 stop:10436 length:318 start_codon:yes stop_codon:yes gene_type:complete